MNKKDCLNQFSRLSIRKALSGQPEGNDRSDMTPVRRRMDDLG